MPGVCSPLTRVARRFRVQPCIYWLSRSSRVSCVIPCARPAIALESEDHSLAVGHYLVHIHFNIGNWSGRRWQINPGVIEKVSGGRIVSERYVKALAAIPRVIAHKRACVPAQRGRVNEACYPVRTAGSRGVTLCDPAAHGLQIANGGCIRRKCGGRSGRIDCDGYIGDACRTRVTPCLDMESVRSESRNDLSLNGCPRDNGCIGAAVKRVAHRSSVLRRAIRGAG